MNSTEIHNEVQTTNINFMGQRNIAMLLSLVLIVASFAGLWIKGLNFGIDFTGGTLIELSYPSPVELPELRNNLMESGFGQAIVQHFGSAEDVLIRIAPQDGFNSAQLSNQVMDALAEATEEARKIVEAAEQEGTTIIENASATAQVERDQILGLAKTERQEIVGNTESEVQEIVGNAQTEGEDVLARANQLALAIINGSKARAESGEYRI